MSKAITFKNRSGEKIYPTPYMPIGSIYLSVNSTNPSTYFGGTWTQIKDRFLLCCGSTYSAGSTGGEANHILSENEIPVHRHYGLSWSNNWNISFERESASTGYGLVWKYGDSGYTPDNIKTGTAGGGQSHNNMPPYLAVYVWKRTA